jgi:hypothetical protein
MHLSGHLQDARACLHLTAHMKTCFCTDDVQHMRKNSARRLEWNSA